MFALASEPIDVASIRQSMVRQDCGGFATFEGWVRDFNEGRPVMRLQYEAFPELAKLEAERIALEANNLFPIRKVMAIHRIGSLELTEIAVWVGVVAVHREGAFDACRYVIDEIKRRVPIWKKEFFADGSAAWTRCEHCAVEHEREH